MTTDTIRALLDRHRGPCLGAPGEDFLDYETVATRVDRVGAQLAGLGYGPGTDIGLVPANGPLAALGFLGVAAHATAAPLNPAYTEDEFAFYLDDLGAKLVVLDIDANPRARAAAARLGIATVRLEAEAGLVDPTGAPLAGTEARVNGPDDTALVLHTSGTTSRPKIVPLTSRNICRSARNIAVTLDLTAEDRCLNVMPLFHIHGLIAAVLATVEAGASIVCAPGFDALKFFAHAVAAKPTWYTAVPTMHQAILARAKRNPEALGALNLRFVRSSSASLPVPVLQALEQTFGCPVIEAYGMTEAAHQMASNPLPPAARKPGSVGPAAGPEVAIMGADAALLPPGEIGEIVIRGENVTPGYRGNDKANAENWTDGWFRTGDEGSLDGDGYLTIRGRLKEIINRGGEKIAPKEVDDVLMDHPGVAQAVTFARPHKMLGEDVAAAIVLAEGAEADEAGLRDHAAARLAPFKVPGTIVIVDEIPKGATGKLQRIGLAEKLGLT
ncbi:MAG: acyl--CoA ligase [Paracoccaceae bacterium]|nr:acyl--CoA ligase [Paracoccaceae bacterium]